MVTAKHKMKTMTKKEFEKGVEESKKRVAGMDKIDGFKDRFTSTILAALEAGIRTDDKTCLFDAWVMLEDTMGHRPKK